MNASELVGWALLAGLAGVTLVNILKNVLNLEDRAAIALTYGVSFVLSIGVLALDGDLLPLDVERFVVVGPAIFLTADAIYRFIVSRQS